VNQSKFSDLKLHPELLNNLTSIGYATMTPIQAMSLPHILAGKDVIGQSKTGSGKTAAFGIGLLEKLNVKRFRVQSLVLCPTRELADQVSKELRKLARTTHNIKVLTLCGGMPFGPQLGSL
jgi:ATP-independent RNA helicase DbpA